MLYKSSYSWYSHIQEEDKNSIKAEATEGEEIYLTDADEEEIPEGIHTSGQLNEGQNTKGRNMAV